MRKIFYAGFCLVLLMGMGCAMTNYVLMVDGETGEIINTDGVKAKVIPIYGQTATINPDGTSDNLLWLAKQDAAGDRELITYNYRKVHEGREADDVGLYFYDFTYCHPGWTGCAIWTAIDREVPWDDIFDGTWDLSCDGAENLKILISYNTRFAECGRMPVQNRMQLIEAGTLTGAHTIQYNINGANTQLYLNNNSGVTSRIPVIGNIQATYDQRSLGTFAMDMTNPLLQNTAGLISDWANANQGELTTATVIFNGIELSFDVKLN